MRILLGLILAAALATSAGASGYRLLRVDGLHLKWGSPSFGDGATVTYGLATERKSFPDAVNCRQLAPLAELTAAWSIPQPRVDKVVADAFGLWAKAAGVVFRPAPPGTPPDILIGAQAEPQSIAFANVWWDAAAARDGVAPLRRASVCLNPRVAWAVGPVKGATDLRYALAHEIGHAIGLDHPGPTGALMGYRSQPATGGLMPGDIAGAVALYGRPAVQPTRLVSR